MGETGKIWMFFGGIMIVAILGWFFYRAVHPKTVADEKKRVGRALRTIVSPRKFQVLDQPVLVLDKLSGWADHIVVGYFGVLLVYDLCLPGEYYGTPDDAKWRVTFDNKRYEVENPRTAAAQCEGRVRVLLKEAGHKVRVERVFLMTGDPKYTVNCTKTPEMVKLGELRKFLGKARFEEDNGVNVEAVTAILNGALKKD